MGRTFDAACCISRPRDILVQTAISFSGVLRNIEYDVHQSRQGNAPGGHRIYENLIEGFP
jgi:hypothetical protein